MSKKIKISALFGLFIGCYGEQPEKVINQWGGTYEVLQLVSQAAKPETHEVKAADAEQSEPVKVQSTKDETAKLEELKPTEKAQPSLEKKEGFFSGIINLIKSLIDVLLKLPQVLSSISSQLLNLETASEKQPETVSAPKKVEADAQPEQQGQEKRSETSTEPNKSERQTSASKVTKQSPHLVANKNIVKDVQDVQEEENPGEVVVEQPEIQLETAAVEEAKEPEVEPNPNMEAEAKENGNGEKLGEESANNNFEPGKKEVRFKEFNFKSWSIIVSEKTGNLVFKGINQHDESAAMSLTLSEEDLTQMIQKHRPGSVNYVITKNGKYLQFAFFKEGSCLPDLLPGEHGKDNTFVIYAIGSASRIKEKQDLYMHDNIIKLDGQTKSTEDNRTTTTSNSGSSAKMTSGSAATSAPATSTQQTNTASAREERTASAPTSTTTTATSTPAPVRPTPAPQAPAPRPASVESGNREEVKEVKENKPKFNYFHIRKALGQTTMEGILSENTGIVRSVNINPNLTVEFSESSSRIAPDVLPLYYNQAAFDYYTTDDTRHRITLRKDGQTKSINISSNHIDTFVKLTEEGMQLYCKYVEYDEIGRERLENTNWKKASLPYKNLEELFNKLDSLKFNSIEFKGISNNQSEQVIIRFTKQQGGYFTFNILGSLKGSNLEQLQQWRNRVSNADVINFKFSKTDREHPRKS